MSAVCPRWVSSAKSTLSGNSFYRGDTEPGASTSLAKKAQFKGRTVHRGNTTGPQFSLPRPHYEGLSYRPTTALVHCCRVGRAPGDTGPQVLSGGRRGRIPPWHPFSLSLDSSLRLWTSSCDSRNCPRGKMASSVLAD